MLGLDYLPDLTHCSCSTVFYWYQFLFFFFSSVSSTAPLSIIIISDCSLKPVFIQHIASGPVCPPPWQHAPPWVSTARQLMARWFSSLGHHSPGFASQGPVPGDHNIQAHEDHPSPPASHPTYSPAPPGIPTTTLFSQEGAQHIAELPKHPHEHKLR